MPLARRTLTAAMLLLWAGPSASWSAPAASAALRAGETRPAVAARAAGLTMALNLPQLGQRPGRGLIPGFLQPMPESIAEGDTRGSTIHRLRRAERNPLPCTRIY